MDIKFNCKNCHQHLVIDDADAGIIVQCPSCDQSLTVPLGQAKIASATITPVLSHPQEQPQTPKVEDQGTGSYILSGGLFCFLGPDSRQHELFAIFSDCQSYAPPMGILDGKLIIFARKPSMTLAFSCQGLDLLIKSSWVNGSLTLICNGQTCKPSKANPREIPLKLKDLPLGLPNSLVGVDDNIRALAAVGKRINDKELAIYQELHPAMADSETVNKMAKTIIENRQSAEVLMKVSATLLILSVGFFILPAFGYQFAVLSGASAAIAVLLGIIGAACLIFGVKLWKS